MISTNFLTALRNHSHAPHLRGIVYLTVTELQQWTDKLLQSPRFTQKASISKLSFPIRPVFHLSGIRFLICLTLTLSSYTSTCIGSVGKRRKAFVTHLPFLSLLKKSLLSQPRGLFFHSKTFNNLSKSFLLSFKVNFVSKYNKDEKGHTVTSTRSRNRT